MTPIEFYLGGHAVSLMYLSDEELERKHDWIQLVFPNREPSPFNPDAPLLDDETVKAFKLGGSEGPLQSYLRVIYGRILLYYFPAHDPAWWATNNNHNFKRFTRMLNFLKEVNPDLCKDLIRRLDHSYFDNELYEVEGIKEALTYWLTAAK